VTDPYSWGPAWDRPKLRAPKTLYLSQRDWYARNGYRVLRLDEQRDYVIDLPGQRRIGGVEIRGGRNVRMIGGHVTPNPEHLTKNDERTNAAIRITGNRGIVHIENVLVDSSIGGQGDALNISNNPNGIVQLINNRFANILAGPGGHWYDGVHADAIQLWAPTDNPWAAVRELRIDKLTASSSASCLQFQEYGPTRLSRVNLSFFGGDGIREQAKLLRLTRPGGCKGSRHELLEVYADATLYPPLEERIAPEAAIGDATWCAARWTEDGNLHWPELPIGGHVTPGPPPGGDFVPEGSVGVGVRGKRQ
jgi:hypothetical protein